MKFNTHQLDGLFGKMPSRVSKEEILPLRCAQGCGSRAQDDNGRKWDDMAEFDR
jgi:hypothetical protein